MPASCSGTDHRDPGGSADSTTTYTPDGLIESLAVNNPEGVVLTEYGYNRRRMLTTESVSQSSPSMLYTPGYGYNGNGHLATLTYPDQQVVGYAPNALGQARRWALTPALPQCLLAGVVFGCQVHTYALIRNRVA